MTAGLARAFVSLEHREFRFLFLATVVAHFGEQLQQFANLWQVYALTESPLHLGLTGLARAVPVILFSLVGGVIADRVDRRKIIILAQITGGLFAVLLAALSFSGLIQVWHIYAVIFLNATLTSASAPARRAVIATMVPRHHLVNALALNTSVNQVDRIIAPSLAGILVALFGLPPTYALNALAHGITAASLAFVPFGTLEDRPHTSPLRDLLDGLRFVRQRSVILVLLSLDVVAMLFGSYRALLPVVAGQFDTGPTGFGLLSSAPAVGSFVGVTLIMYLGDFPYKGRVIVGGIFAYCGALALLGITPWFWLALVATALLGLTDASQATVRGALIQMITPDELRGRVSAFQHMLQGGGPALGQSTLGGAAGLLGTPVALLAGAVCAAAVCLGIVGRRPDMLARDLGMPAPADSRLAVPR